MPRRSRQTAGPRLLVAAVATLLAIAACNASSPTPAPSASTIATPSPSPSPSGAASPAPSGPSPSGAASPTPATSVGPPSTASPALRQLAAQIESQVSALRGLPVKQEVPPAVMSDAQLRAYIERTFSQENPPETLAANERLLKALGLLPKDASLQQLSVELLSGQVAGFYSPDDKKLYAISRTGSVGALEKATFAHEYTHALQDQSFDLKGLHTDQIGQGDRGLGRLALVEGDATLVMSYWVQQHLTPAELSDMMRASSDPEQLRLLGEMPAILRDPLLFPYTTGLQFALGLQAPGGWQAVDAAFRNPPASTEQVMHPEKYAAHEAPIDVSLPADLAARLGSGWKTGMTDTFGEFQMGIWLRQGGGNATLATNAAAGWGGDRITLLDGPSGAWAIAWKTAWDSNRDAAEFEASAKAVLPRVSGRAAVLPGEGGPVRWVVAASDEAGLAKLENVLGLAR